MEELVIETFIERGYRRLRARPGQGIPSHVRFAFPRHLRGEHPLGTRFVVLARLVEPRYIKSYMRVEERNILRIMPPRDMSLLPRSRSRR